MDSVTARDGFVRLQLRLAARRFFRQPARLIVSGFAVAILVGTGLLMLPAATKAGESSDLITALFTATSAVCVAGLVVVDTSGHWSWFGDTVIIVLVQGGGLGIMTLASLLGMLVVRRMGLRMQHVGESQTQRLRLGEIRRVVLGVVKLTLVVEAATAVALAARYAAGYDAGFWAAARFGVFHSIAAFNNAGFALFNDNLAQFSGDPFILVPMVVAMVLGGLGFPVVFEVARHMRRTLPRRSKRRVFSVQHWTLHTKVTLLAYGALVGVGVFAVLSLEWGNPRTFGPMGVWEKLNSGLLHGISPRTAGFQTVDIGELHPATLLVTDVLMFIGGGSASTAGGIKVTTFALLAFVIAAEIRGQPTVHVLGRRLSDAVQRQAVAVALLGIAAVIAGTTALLVITDFELDAVLFEVISAFGTVGLSTGITADLPTAGHLLLIVLMFVGRLGPITLATVLALRERARRFDLPEERPLVG